MGFRVTIKLGLVFLMLGLFAVNLEVSNAMASKLQKNLVVCLDSSTAQSPPHKGTKRKKFKLDLTQLINMAIAHSPEVRQMQSEVEVSKSDLSQIKAAYYPQLDLTAVTGPADDAKEPVIVNNKISDPSPGTSLSNVGIFGRLDFTITQPVFTFGKLSYRKEAATRGVQARKFAVEQKKGDIAFRVKQLYYALVQSQGGMDVADQADEYFDEARRRIIRLLELESVDVTESDLYRLDAFRAETARSRAQAEKGAQVAYFALKSMIGLGPSKDFEPADTKLSIDSKRLPALSTYIDKALQNRPEYKQLLEAIEAQKYQAKAAHSDRFPSFFVAMEGSVARAPGRDSVDSPYLDDEFNHAYVGVIAGMKWNFDFGIAKAKEVKMRAEFQKLIHAKASAEMNIPIQVANIYQQAREWKTAAEAYHQAAIAARKWVITALTEFDMGVGTAANMIDAIEKYGSNEGHYLESVYKYLVTLAELAHAAGIKDWQEESTE